MSVVDRGKIKKVKWWTELKRTHKFSSKAWTRNKSPMDSRPTCVAIF
jgi:hypothetical protein